MLVLIVRSECTLASSLLRLEKRWYRQTPERCITVTARCGQHNKHFERVYSPCVIETESQLENIGSRIDMQTHAGSSSTRPLQHASLGTVMVFVTV